MAFLRCALPAGVPALKPSRFISRLLIVALASASTLALIPAVAHADPKVTAASAQARLQALSDRAEILSEQFNAAQAKLDAANRALAADKAAIAKAQKNVDATRALVAGVASGAYESGGLSTANELMSSGEPEVALQKAAILSMLADQRGQQLRNATAARNKLAQTQVAANQQAKAIQALHASLTAQQKTLDAMVAQQEALLKASQGQIAADNAKAAARAAQAAAAARSNRSMIRAAAPRAAAPQVIVPVSADGRAAAAIRYAYAQLGKPYRYGGAGPNSFDCSGLTMRAWQAAGVSIGHNAAGQYYSTPHVSRSQLQPGDLVYFGHPIHHVGIYIGGGNMIEAPYTGANVRITNFGYRHDYAGASRP
ncbi:MAG TPA: NlpC/P60 family protein [Acidothermaceae bacterium]|nr:NlpC/P60 family protein [Acidothermaceae bacterium]